MQLGMILLRVPPLYLSGWLVGLASGDTMLAEIPRGEGSGTPILGPANHFKRAPRLPGDTEKLVG